MNDFKGQSIDAVLRELLKQGRLDPGAEQLAAQGLDRLKTFLNGTPAPAPAAPRTAEEILDDLEPEVLEDDGVAFDDGLDAGADGVGDGLLEHTVPLRGGRYAHVVVPEGLTRADADRIAGVLAALALDPEDGDE